jgi:hypothetical protein
MPESPEEDIDALCVAYLAAQGRTQIDIARTLNLSQSAVSRLYARVKDTYIKTVFCEEKLSAEMSQKVRLRTCPHAVEERLKALAKKYDQEGPVVHSIFIRAGSDEVEQFEQFAAGAAPIVLNLLKQVRKTVGVAWGRTLWQTAQHLRSLVEAPWRATDPINFIPLCGEPLVDTQNAQAYADRTSSRIASELSRIANGDKPRPVWLGAVPAFIPRTFSERDQKVIDRLIDLVPYYGRIFGPRNRKRRHERPLVEDLDMILTAAGDSKHPVGFGKTPLLQLDAREAQELTDQIYGDIGGVLIPKTNPNSKKITSGKSLVGELTHLWTGLKMEHLQLCARQAFAEHGDHGRRPGVTLLGYREGLADLVCQAVQRGLVNHLIIGSALEPTIERALAPEFAIGSDNAVMNATHR